MFGEENPLLYPPTVKHPTIKSYNKSRKIFITPFSKTP
jgi:hypothetical protein